MGICSGFLFLKGGIRVGVGATVEIRVIGAERYSRIFLKNACGIPICILSSFMRYFARSHRYSRYFLKFENHYECRKMSPDMYVRWIHRHID
jgi:hypothetical protein